MAAGCLMVGVMLASPRAQGPAGWGPAGPGHGKSSGPGTVAPIPVDPGRPWGWAVKAFMDDPGQPLYNTTKQKLLEGKQVFSQTITQFDIKAYCEGAAKFDFSRFEMQHSDAAVRRSRKDDCGVPAGGRHANPPDSRMRPRRNVQRAADVGVLGIIVPTVDDAIEARSVAMFARFPPIARRSTGGGQAGSIWSPVIQKPKTFRSTINDNMLVIVMIETQEAREERARDCLAARRRRRHYRQRRLRVVLGIPTGQRRAISILQTRVRNATYLAGKFWGNANPGFSKNNPLAADSRFHLGVPPK